MRGKSGTVIYLAEHLAARREISLKLGIPRGRGPRLVAARGSYLVRNSKHDSVSKHIFQVFTIL